MKSLRHTQSDVAKALRIATAHLPTYAAACGIRLKDGDTLSDAQVASICDYIDQHMVDEATAAQLTAAHRALRNNPPVRRKGGALNPKAVRAN